MSKPFHKSLVGTFVLIGVICFALYWVFFFSLGWITGHGEEVIVPKLMGKSLKTSVKQLENAGFEVDIDSIYSPEHKPLTILNQQPEGGSTVKKGRTIFLIINKVNPPNSPMPNLVNMSFRSAELLLKSAKLVLGDTIMKPDIAAGAVLAQMLNGKEISPGTLVPQGSKITLVVGEGVDNKQITVPDLIGFKYQEAIAILSGNGITYSVVFDGAITDSSSAVVYMQLPEAFNDFNEPNKILQNEYIDIRVKQKLEESDLNND